MPMKQNRDTRNKPLCIWLNDLWREWVARLYNGKKIVASTNGLGKPDVDVQKDKVETLSYHHVQKRTQNGLKTYMYVWPDTLKLSKENIGGNLHGIELGNGFFDITKSPENKSKNRQFRLHKDILEVRKTINRLQRQLSSDKKYFQTICLIRGYYTEYLKNSYNTTTNQ